MSVWSFSCAVLGLLLAPLLLGVTNRTKAVFAGRRGPPLLQAYYDLAKLLRKGTVYSRTTSWVFRLAPLAGLACVVPALFFMPVGDFAAPLAFPGDLVLVAYLLGLMRFMTVCAALDTGSSFEGMGASREVEFAALAEPALLLGFAALSYATGSFSLSGILGGIARPDWLQAGPAVVLVSAAFMIVFLAENCRIPVDDPNTHLELTMIHEVMILDYGGPDLAFILYGSALKLWLLGALLANIFLSLTGISGPAQVAGFVAGMLAVAVVTGVIESVMARLSLLKVPQLLVGAAALSVLGFILMLRFVP
jgi:formate hydrogenlyase subunit 4